MAEPGGQIETRPTACPFVALATDRDSRTDHPDPRHRCFAEDPPAPRTIAHQERFCLSTDFATCPVFAEWAARAAARPVHAAGPIPATPLVATGTKERWPDSMEATPSATAPPAAISAADETAGAGTEQLAAFELPAEPVGLAAPVVPPPAAAPEATDEAGDVPLPTFLAGRSPRPRATAQPVAETDIRPGWDTEVRRSSREPDDRGGGDTFTRLLTMAAVIIILALGVATVLIVPGLLAGGSPSRTPRPSSVAGSLPPTLPTATNVAVLPSGPPAEPSVTVPSVAPTPLATPTPSPRTYKIKVGDTLARIARDFGLTVDDILAANPQLANADHIEVGQRIVIPSAASSPVP